MKNYFTPWRKYGRYAIILIPRILRQFVFHCTKIIKSDELYIKIVYFLTYGKWLNLNNRDTLKTFNEKIQWLKLFYDSPIYTQMADKLAVREIIEREMGPGHVFPLLGVWKAFDDIDFKALPDKFVLKATHDSGSIVFCRDKESFDYEAAKKKLEQALRRNYYWFGRERPYKNIPPRIIAEPLMTDESGIQLKDFKLFCFSGEVKIIQVDFNRFTDHKRNLYTPQWELLDMFILYPNAPNIEIPKPKQLDNLLIWGEKLSAGFPFVRIDFYVIDDKLYFGEFTFSHGSGLERIKPQVWNDILGSWIQLPTTPATIH